MADHKRKAPGTAEGARSRRPPPTIDLTAEEIKAEPAAPPSETEPIYAGRDNVTDTPTREFLSGAAGGGTATGGNTAQTGTRPSENRPLIGMPYVLAGLAGGALVAAVLFTLWLTGMVPIRYAGATAMRARVGLLELQMRELHNHPPAALDPATIEAINGRLDKIEQSLAQSPVKDGADSERVAAVENSLKALGIAIAGINRRTDEVAGSAIAAREQAEVAVKAVTELRGSLSQMPAAASRSELDALQTRISALETAAKVAGQDTASSAALGATVRSVLAATALRDAALRGEPIAAELAAATVAGADAKSLAALEPFAATGLPSDVALARELMLLIPPMLQAAGAQASAGGGILERLQANAGKLVRIRPVKEPVGDEPAAILARLEDKAAHNDVAGARLDVRKLPEKAQQIADGWSKRVAARDAATAAARQIAADAIRALASP